MFLVKSAVHRKKKEKYIYTHKVGGVRGGGWGGGNKGNPLCICPQPLIPNLGRGGGWGVGVGRRDGRGEQREPTK